MEKTADKTPQKRGDFIEGRCRHYLERKRRYCRSLPGNNSQYCVEHSHFLNDGTVKKRITCPLDPNHSCYESQLSSHLKKCNARESLQPEYYSKNINLENAEVPQKEKMKTLGEHHHDQKLQTIATVERLFEKFVKAPQEEILSHDVLTEAINDPVNGRAAQKKLQQVASLVGHMEQQQLLKDGICYMEFGAGRAELSHWVQKSLVTFNENKYLLVEKSGCRYKKDSYHKEEDEGVFERLRIDIQHLCLNKVPTLTKNAHLPIVGIGKHLCGGGTDLMLRCLANQASDPNLPSGEKVGQLSGIVLALCCHHRCDWQSYVGKQFFQDQELTPEDFHVIVSMTSWATCGTRKFLDKLSSEENVASKESLKKDDSLHTSSDREHTDSEKDLALHHASASFGKRSASIGSDKEYEKVQKKSIEQTVKAESIDNSTKSQYENLSPEEKEKIGRKCKLLLDTGRLMYLNQFSYQSKLVNYISEEISLENTVLIAKKQE